MGDENEAVTARRPDAPHFLVHDEGDDVAVAVQDVEPGRARLTYLDSERKAEVDVTEPVPLGHKVALTDLAADADVIEYRVRVAKTRQAIAKGQLVHVHNVRSARWERSA
ncbi:MAG: UxaA family hydrolase [Candidatus Dormiibacterota bacterium]